MSKEERILGIDYGTRRVGLAMSDPLEIIATPFDTISKGKVFGKIKELVDEFDISKIIVGYPLRINGEKGKRAKEVEEFAEELTKRFHISTLLWDERYSTLEAEDIIRNKERKLKKQKGKVDKVAAAVILQSYLDSREDIEH